jgi:hypothetical protein
MSFLRDLVKLLLAAHVFSTEAINFILYVFEVLELDKCSLYDYLMPSLRYFLHLLSNGGWDLEQISVANGVSG